MAKAMGGIHACLGDEQTENYLQHHWPMGWPQAAALGCGGFGDADGHTHNNKHLHKALVEKRVCQIGGHLPVILEPRTLMGKNPFERKQGERETDIMSGRI